MIYTDEFEARGPQTTVKVTAEQNMKFFDNENKINMSEILTSHHPKKKELMLMSTQVRAERRTEQREGQR